MEEQPPHLPSQHQQPPVMKSNWPVTFGIIGLVFGVLGFVAAAYKMATTYAFKNAETNFGASFKVDGKEMGEDELRISETMETMFSQYTQLAGAKMFVDGVLAILAVMLFVGAILLILRYRISKPLLLVWSYSKIFVGLAGVYLSNRAFQAMAGSMGQMMDQTTGAAGGSASTVDFSKIYGAMGIASMVFGAIWLAALPVLFLIWFNRLAIKDDMANGYGWK